LHNYIYLKLGQRVYFQPFTNQIGLLNETTLGAVHNRRPHKITKNDPSSSIVQKTSALAQPHS